MGNELAKALKSRREELGLTHYALWKQTGVQPHNIKAIEDGASGGRIETVECLFNAMGGSLTVNYSSSQKKWSK